MMAKRDSKANEDKRRFLYQLYICRVDKKQSENGGLKSRYLTRLVLLLVRGRAKSQF